LYKNTLLPVRGIQVIVTEVPAEMAFNINYLLNTNSTPSHEHRKDLQDFIFQLDEAILNTDEDISGINEQILAMQARILVLQTRRTGLVQQRKCYSSLLSPVRCLPVEIFGKIFVYATRDRPRHVLNISAVCQLWRDAALSTPMLWSTLEFGHHTTRRNMDNHINSWIERARSYPLSLVIRNRTCILDPVKTALTLLPNYKWKSISLDGDLEGILSILNELKFSDLEMLESFSLRPRFCDEIYLPDSLRYVPKLKTLLLAGNLKHLPQFVKFDTLPFPWRQLTSLTITFPCFDYGRDIILDILQACVNLEEFIKEGVFGGDKLANGSMITMNYLRKLHTHGTDKYLLSLKTPSIHEFATNYLDNYTDTVTGTDDYIDDYIKKNGSTLLKLIAPVSSIFVGTIPYLRSLVELELYDNEPGLSMMYNILSSLVVNPEKDIIPLPRLKVLEIICYATEDNHRMLIEVIDSRWWSDEEENARQKQGQRSLSRIKRCIFTDVRNELDMFQDMVRHADKF
jgi:hypothetical protein